MLSKYINYKNDYICLGQRWQPLFRTGDLLKWGHCCTFWVWNRMLGVLFYHWKVLALLLLFLQGLSLAIGMHVPLVQVGLFLKKNICSCASCLGVGVRGIKEAARHTSVWLCAGCCTTAWDSGNCLLYLRGCWGVCCRLVMYIKGVKLKLELRTTGISLNTGVVGFLAERASSLSTERGVMLSLFSMYFSCLPCLSFLGCGPT